MERIDLDDTSYILTGFLSNDLNYDFDKLWDLHPDKYNKVNLELEPVKMEK